VNIIMGAVILKSEQDMRHILILWIVGIDVIKSVVKLSDGIDSYVWGVEVYVLQVKSSMFCTHFTKASITSKYNVVGYTFFRKKRLSLLLDDYQSILEIPFIDYIYGAGLEWVVCLGVHRLHIIGKPLTLLFSMVH
jgi:hypothetical protein